MTSVSAPVEAYKEVGGGLKFMEFNCSHYSFELNLSLSIWPPLGCFKNVKSLKSPAPQG